MSCEVDWQLALEYVKALAGPIATLMAVYLVARLGVETFRRQKTIERRLEWYERIHRHLGQTAFAYTQAASRMAARLPDAQKHMDKATDSANDLSALVNEAWIYANQEGLDAVHSLVVGMNTMDFPGLSDPAKTQAIAGEIAHLYQKTAAFLATDIRKEMSMPLLTVRPSVLTKR